MLITDTPLPVTSVRATGSLAMELFWVLSATRKTELLRDYPDVAAAYASVDGLAERVATFWDDDLYGAVELVVLAHHAGVLTEPPGDLPAFLEAIGRACESAPADLRLATETAAEREAILARLRRLRRSRPLRSRYLALLSDAWSLLADAWDGHGRDLVSGACETTARRVAGEDDWLGLLERECHRAGCDVFASLVRDVASARAEDGTGAPSQVVLAYAAYGGKLFLLDLPDTFLAAFPAAKPGAAARRASEDLARRLRAVADPTRLAILDRLAELPRAVGELAAELGLAQPTVSNHLKVLREAGLVAGERRGTRRELAVDRDGLAALADELGRLAGATTGRR